ncbi:MULTISPECIES: hypothetical protein [Vibrio]|uniref:hypothetical protein n=1 Tax=Vibrio TaxID=662 RepID=UPI0008934BFF|nr:MULTISPECIES: hypothetical protein [Vibrio]OFJ28747.1 hypothetical protein BFX31_06695 [Vibrio paracholerae]TXX46814.1 hypothetical protein FXF14_14375 [Vibrio cholerae]TYA07913.1 hypothetical protein FXE34_09765 [Vibrio cholerae]WOQ99622.1 hypothetical protein R4537_12065 [Vibrio paracholerae]
MALTKNLSLTQTLGAVFLCITILMISLSVTSLRGIERVGAQFNQLSEQALPFALNNAALTQNFLEQVKYLGYGTRSQSEQELNQATEEQKRATADVNKAVAQISEQGQETKRQLDAMLESAEQVAEIAGHQQAMLHKYELN